MRRVFAVAMMWVLGACGSGPTSAEELCVAVVNVHGTLFTTSGASPVAGDSVTAESYLTVSRNRGCSDQPQPAIALGHSESSFLPAGTGLHEVEGTDPAERLVFWSDVVNEWLVLEPLVVP